MNQRILIDQLDSGSGREPEETAGTPLEEAERPGQESEGAPEGTRVDLGDCRCRRVGVERDAQRRKRIGPRPQVVAFLCAKVADPEALFCEGWLNASFKYHSYDSVVTAEFASESTTQ